MKARKWLRQGLKFAAASGFAQPSVLSFLNLDSFRIMQTLFLLRHKRSEASLELSAYQKQRNTELAGWISAVKGV